MALPLHLWPMHLCWHVLSLCCCAGLSLSIKRLVLLNVTVAPLASTTNSPKLLRLGLFAQPVTNLTLVDVRFSVPPDIFQQYLAFFGKFLLAVKTKSDGGVGMHTVSLHLLGPPGVVVLAERQQRRCR